ncbi:MAG: prefoldin subunit [Nanobdellota archaeon]
MSQDEMLSQLQFLEDRLSQTMNQKQSYQQFIYDIDSALSELDTVSSAYHIVGTIMVKKSSDTLKSDLTEKKELYEKRLKSIEQQEESLKKEVSALQSKVKEQLSN